MTDKEIAKAGGDILHIPTVMGAVAVVYNLPGVRNLNLDADTLADIFLGKITNWQGVNSSLPNMPIKVCYRSDGSGTTSIFTGYLAKVSLDWASKVGAGKAVAWPTGIGGKGNEGVSAYVKRVKGAIGYVEYAYALQNKFNTIQLQNHAKQFVSPSIETFQAAAANANWESSSDFFKILVDQPGKSSWPISGASFILFHKEQKDKKHAKAILDFFAWCFKNGEAAAKSLHYIPLPQSVVTIIQNQWRTVIKSWPTFQARYGCTISRSCRAIKSRWSCLLTISARAG